MSTKSVKTISFDYSLYLLAFFSIRSPFISSSCSSSFLNKKNLISVHNFKFKKIISHRKTLRRCRWGCVGDVECRWWGRLREEVVKIKKEIVNKMWITISYQLQLILLSMLQLGSSISHSRLIFFLSKNINKIKFPIKSN